MFQQKEKHAGLGSLLQGLRGAINAFPYAAGAPVGPPYYAGRFLAGYQAGEGARDPGASDAQREYRYGENDPYDLEMRLAGGPYDDDAYIHTREASLDDIRERHARLDEYVSTRRQINNDLYYGRITREEYENRLSELDRQHGRQKEGP